MIVSRSFPRQISVSESSSGSNGVSSMAEPLQRRSHTTLYLQKIELENFGRFRHESFEFHQHLNVIDGRNGAGKTTVLKAIEILLWPTQNEVAARVNALASRYMVASETGKLPSAITGYFLELANNHAPTGIQHSLCASVSETGGKAAVRFHWNGTARGITQVREILAEYGLQATSVFFLSEEKIATRELVPMDFFRSKLDEIPLKQQAKRQIEAIESRSQSFLEDLEDYSLTSAACQATERKVRNLLNSSSVSSEFGMREEVLKKYVAYSEFKSHQKEASQLEEKIEKRRQCLDRAEAKCRTTKARMAALRGQNTSDSTPADSADDEFARDYSVVALDDLKKDLIRTRERVAELGESSGSWKISETEERSLEEKMERLKQRSLGLFRKSMRLKLREHSKAIRLKFLHKDGGTGHDEAWYRRALEQNIELLEDQRRISECDQREVEKKLSELQKRLRETTALKDVAEMRLEDTEHNLGIFHDSEILESFAITELEEHMSTGRDFDTLESDVMSSLGPDFLQLLGAMPPILEELGVPNESEWASFGYLGTIIDHIDVESKFRAFTYPLKRFLATFLVRDFEIAWRLREATQEVEFHDGLNMICLNDYKPSEEQFLPPEGFEKLSRYLKLNPQSRIALDEKLRSRLQEVVDSELRHYFVIRGDAAGAHDIVEGLLQSPQWRLCRFVTHDGTCFSLNETLDPAGGKDPISAYENLNEYWGALRSQISDRVRDLGRLRAVEEKCRSEHSQLLNIVSNRVKEVGSIHMEIQSLLSSCESLKSESIAIDSDIKELRDRIDRMGGEYSHVAENEVSDQFGVSSAGSELIDEEKRRLDDSVSKTMSTLACVLIDSTIDDLDCGEYNELRSRVSVLESEIDNVEGFMERIADGEDEANEEEEEPFSAERASLEDSPPLDSEVTNLRTTIFLLRKKLELVREAISAVKNIRAPVNWIAERNYATELEKLREQSTTGTLSTVVEGSRKKLTNLAGKAPRMHRVSMEALETLKRIFDVSPEKSLLPGLGLEALNSLVERFRATFLELAPAGEVRLVEGRQERTHVSGEGASMNTRRKIEANGVLSQSAKGQGDVVEVSFNSAVSKPRVPSQLSGGEGAILALSVLLSPTALAPPRLLLLDEVDAPFDYPTQSRFAKFVNGFRHGCQTFVVSHKAPRASLAADRRILVEYDFELRESHPS